MPGHNIFRMLEDCDNSNADGLDVSLDHIDLSVNTIAGDTAGGALIPTSIAATGAVTTSSLTGGIGYATGAGGVETQSSTKVTTISVSPATMCGTITMAADALAGGAEASCTVTNTNVAASDVIVCCCKNLTNVSGSGALQAGTYQVTVSAVQAGSFIMTLTNLTIGSLSEAVVINWAILRSVAA